MILQNPLKKKKKKMNLPRVMEIGQYIHMISITKKVLIIWTFHIDKTVYPVNIDPFAMKINRGHNQVIDKCVQSWMNGKF